MSSTVVSSSSSSSASAMLRSCSVLLALVICCLAMGACTEAGPAFPEFRGSSFGLVPQREERYNNLIEALMMQGGLGRVRGRANGFVDGGAPSKRQLRYHQCYFNPVSCFRRK
ncbi:uncharacterized protein LOC111262149 [Varroa jacobsoni]|uniref:uncharacterized protein LOC111262149 n=1 Tax=Varroa jacobsoni TaxID=62625 RepID=UPI000BF67F13|nr:uncharacterized protein LOC111262149 [Varroa jacobsoni]